MPGSVKPRPIKNNIHNGMHSILNFCLCYLSNEFGIIGFIAVLFGCFRIVFLRQRIPDGLGISEKVPLMNSMHISSFW